GGIVALREDRAMNFGMQRLHAAVHHLGEAGDVGHVGDGQAEVAKELGGSAGAQQLDLEFLVQRLGKVGQAGLVGNTQQRAPDGDEVGHAKKGKAARAKSKSLLCAGEV